MNITFAPNNMLQIDDARIVYRNFEGRGDKFNREGDRNFALVIPTEEIKDKLLDDVNQCGVGWNVKIKASREEGGDPFMYLPVKVKFTDRGPSVYLKSGKVTKKLDKDTIFMLDDIDIMSVDLDIRPYDDKMNGRPLRAAYLHAMHVTQRVDRFRDRMEEDENADY